MQQIIIVIHVLLGLGIIGLILIQQGKGADAGASFGTGSSGSVFGAQGAGSFLSRTTATLASLFFITSLGLAVLNGRQGSAYDLMSSEAAKKDHVVIPQTDINKTVENLLTPPEQKPLLATTPLTPVVEPNATEKTEANPVAEENKEAGSAEVHSFPEVNAPITKQEIKSALESVKPAALAPKKEATKPATPNKTTKPKKEAAKTEKKKAAPKKKDSEKK